MKKRNNKDDRQIEDLLRRSKEGNLADDFEREAAEGFSMLGEPGEAFQSKQAVDSRMNDLIYERRKPLLVYWSMAAGLILVIGLTVFLMRDSGTLGTNDVLSHAEIDAVVQPLPARHSATKSEPSSPTDQVADQRKEMATSTSLKKEKITESSPAAEPAATTEAENTGVIADEAPPYEITASEMAQAAPPPPVPSPEPSVPAASYEKAVRPQPLQTGDTDQKKEEHSRRAAPAAAGEPSRDLMFMTDENSVPTSLIKECVEDILKRKMPVDLMNNFVATLLVNDGWVKNVKFMGGTDLTGPQKDRIDSLIRKESSPCLGSVTGNQEVEVPVTYKP